MTHVQAHPSAEFSEPRNPRPETPDNTRAVGRTVTRAEQW